MSPASVTESCVGSARPSSLQAGGDVEQDLELDGATVLHLVDEEMRDVERRAFDVDERPAQHLPDAQEQRVILAVERRRLAVAIVLRADARLAHAPLVDLIELTLTEVVTEEGVEERAARRELVPRAEHAARLGAELLTERLDGAARDVGQTCSVASS